MKSLATFAAITFLGLAAVLHAVDRDRPEVQAQADEPAPVPRSPAARVPVRPPSTAPLPDLPKGGHHDIASAPSQRNADAEISERRAQLQAQFDSQAVDASWAMESRQLLRDDFGKYANADVRVRDLDCRSSMCRIALASSNRAAQQSFIEDWIRHRAWTGSGFAVEDGDATIVYVSKPGVDLPN